jgi:hypothetical protein
MDPHRCLEDILLAFNRADLDDEEREVLAGQLEDLAGWVRINGFTFLVTKTTDAQTFTLVGD